jgi:hypothetical protein
MTPTNMQTIEKGNFPSIDNFSFSIFFSTSHVFLLNCC